MISAVTHNFYSEFFRSFKSFIDKLTGNTITHFEFDYGSKTVDFHRMYDDEGYEYPLCVIEMQDTTLVDSVGPIARNAMMNVNPSNHNMVIAENLSKQQVILLDKRWVNLMFTVTLSVEDSAAIMNYYNLITSQIPFNFSFYDYKYITYLDVTPFMSGWDFNNEDIMNIFIRKDPTGYDEKYYAMIENVPLIELTSITKNNQKEEMDYSITMNFEVMLEVPNLLRGRGYHDVRSISVVIDTIGSGEVNPILIDIPDNLLTNKNIEKGIILSEKDFHLGYNGEDQFLQISSDIDIEAFGLALWVVEDTTDATSKRIFIPLLHSKISKIYDEDDNFLHWQIEFNEINWFFNFNFNGDFNFINLILFDKQ